MQSVLENWARQFGFWYGVQRTDDVARFLDSKGIDYARSLLTDDEYNHFKKFRVAKRKIEWLAGRIAAKAAVANYRKVMGNGRSTPPVSVLNRTNRAPFIAEYPDLVVSITHSHEYAIAVVAAYPMGIDLEKIEPRPLALVHYFFTPEEYAALVSEVSTPIDRHAFVTRLWSRKEAVVKCLQVGATIDFRQMNAIPERVRMPHSTSRVFRVITEDVGGYFLTFATEA